MFAEMSHVQIPEKVSYKLHMSIPYVYDSQLYNFNYTYTSKSQGKANSFNI